MNTWNHDSEEDKSPEEEEVPANQEYWNDYLFLEQMDNKGRQFSLEIFFNRTNCSANLDKILKCVKHENIEEFEKQSENKF